MRLDDYPEKEGKQVWLRQEEVDLLLDQADHSTKRLATLLGARSGLRRSEITSVTPKDFEHAPDGFVRVWEDYAKRGKYREAPVPPETEHTVRVLSDVREPEEPAVNVTGKTVYRWVQRAASRLYDETEDEGWTFLDVHDLRRTWGGDLLWNQGVLPSVVMNWGGWEDWDTFRKHYLGEMSPEAAERERSKIEYMDGQAESDEVRVFEPGVEAVR